MKEYLEKKFKNKKVLILGWGREGKSTFSILKKYLPDLEIAIADQDEKIIIDIKDVKRFYGKNYLDHLSDFDIIVKSPGVSGLNPKIVSAQKNGVEITSQTKIFFDVCLGKIIGVTGTKGKSTTSSLTYEILKSVGLDVSLVGNIGNPVLDSLKDNSRDKYYVFELSSHQLFDLEKSPHIALVTNVAVDHLDWYGNIENYIDAKTHIIKYQTESDIAILNWDNIVARGFARFSRGPLFYTSKVEQPNGAYVAGGVIYLNVDDVPEKLGDSKELSLLGKHNWDNVMLAALAAKSIGVKTSDMWKPIVDFKPLEHHLEFVRELDGVAFYNDSFAVDQIATIAAINSFDKDITLILGGFDRGIDYSELASEIAKKENIKNIILIGTITEKIDKYLRKFDYKGNINKLGHVTMIRIVEAAIKLSSKGDIVLFSPAAASFDMFKDYKDRGEQFKKVVNELK